VTEKRVAVITGAAQGIGRATAKRLNAQGWALALVDLQDLDLGTNGDAAAFVGDITDEGFISRLVSGVQDRFGRADALVNNAGISMIRPALETGVDDYRRVLEVNLVAPFLLAKHFAPILMRSRAGSIVNVASVAGMSGIAERSAYNASKHGLIGLARTLAVEWGAKGVRVNCVAPGWVKTEMDHKDQAGGSYSDSDITEHVPMGRFARPEDIANAIAFLCDSDISGFINGAVLPVDGGWTADGSWQSLRLRQR
jgi:NAD(P)-dependent dehydrogenase (short-subunit alcohol dehydrogenase family)